MERQMLGGVRAPLVRQPPRTKLTAASKWLFVLMAAICFEGLGRKFLPFVPSAFFYFLKDGVLIACVLRFGVSAEVKRVVFRYVGSATIGIAVFSMLWTLVQCINYNQTTVLLPLVGLRAYWLWWAAPLIIASMLKTRQDESLAIRVLGLVSLIVAAFAFIQYLAPARAAINTYALYEGVQVNEVDVVYSSGRARVSSTFSYLTGFVNFVVLVPPLILAFSLEFGRGNSRYLAYAVLAATLITMPMSGSRSALILAGLNLFLVAAGAGFLASRIGRRVVVGTLVVAALSVVLLPESVDGVLQRFALADTSSRLSEFSALLPPFALADISYPLAGTGTGTTQNVAYALRLNDPRYYAEGEVARLLVELGPVGYIAVWSFRLGITFSFIKAARALKRGGRGGLAGVALMLALQAQLGRFIADHVFQSLYFLVAAFVVQALVTLPSQVVVSSQAARRRNSEFLPVTATRLLQT